MSDYIPEELTVFLDGLNQGRGEYDALRASHAALLAALKEALPILEYATHAGKLSSKRDIYTNVLSAIASAEKIN